MGIPDISGYTGRSRLIHTNLDQFTINPDQRVDEYTFCLLFSYLIKIVALLIFICCYQHVLVNKDIQFKLVLDLASPEGCKAELT